MNTARLNQGTPLLLNAVSKHYAENIILNQLNWKSMSKSTLQKPVIGCCTMLSFRLLFHSAYGTTPSFVNIQIWSPIKNSGSDSI